MAGCSDNNATKMSVDVVHPAGVDTISVAEVREVLNASEIVDDYKLVSLKTDDLLVGRVSKILFAKGNIYIADKSRDRIFAFDMDGEMLFHIDASGNGPEEYSKLHDFGLNVSRGVIEVQDSPRKAIVQYDMYTGAFAGVTYYDFWTRTFSPLPNGSRLYNMGHMIQEPYRPDSLQSEVYITDDQNRILRSYLPHEISGLSKIFYLTLENIYRAADGGVIFVPMFDNHIYKADGSELKLRYFLNFGDKSLPEDYVLNFNQDPSLFPKVFTESGLSSYIENFYETSRHVTFTYYFNGGHYKVIYDKNTGESINYKFWSYDEYLFGVSPVGVSGDYYVTIVEYEMIEQRVDFFVRNVKPDARENYPDYKEMKALLDSQEAKNPILVLTSFKPVN